MSFTEDLSVFFDTDDFADIANIGSAFFTGVIDRPTAVALEYAQGRRTTFMCRVSDLPAITLGTSTLTVNATRYTIVEQDDDGTGVAVLTLADPETLSLVDLELEGGPFAQFENGRIHRLED